MTPQQRNIAKVLLADIEVAQLARRAYPKDVTDALANYESFMRTVHLEAQEVYTRSVVRLQEIARKREELEHTQVKTAWEQQRAAIEKNIMLANKAGQG